jgi:hypothetical protein
MCCGKSSAPAGARPDGSYDAKMPDGTVVSVTSSGQEKAERDKVFTRMRSQSKGGYTATRS